MKTADVIARYLSAAGIDHVFGYPGDPNIDLIEGLRREGTAFVLARREGTAGFMASAYGFLTGRPGVAISTLGPGSSSLVNGVATALMDRVPMIAISGQIETRREQVFTHQVLDHNRMFDPVSKWTTHVTPETVSTVLRRALRTAVAERPGPVHITTHADVIGAEAIDDAIVLPPVEAAGGAAQMFGRGIEDAAKRIRDAARPVIVAGISAVRGGASDAVAHLAETLGAPVVVAPMAKGVVTEDHPYFAGVLDMACNDFVWEFLGSADLIVAAGFDAVELIKPWQPTAPVIHVDSTLNTDQIYAAEIELVGDIAALLDGLSSAYAGEARWSEKEIADHRAKLAELYYAGRVPDALNPTDVIDILREALPRATRTSTDVGSHKLLVGQGWRTFEPKGVLMTNGLSSMGYSLPGAMTSRLIDPGRETLCITGDGGFAMVQGELRLAASLGLGMTVVVLCDNSLNRIELKQMARQYPSAGTRIEPTDTAMVAEAMDCVGVNVSDAAGLEKALAGDRPADRPLVIGVEIDPAQYAAQF